MIDPLTFVQTSPFPSDPQRISTFLFRQNLRS